MYKIFFFAILLPDLSLIATKGVQETHIYYFKGELKFQSAIFGWLFVLRGQFAKV